MTAERGRESTTAAAEAGPPGTSAGRAPVGGRLRRFLCEERGAVIALFFPLFLVMLMAGGLALDVMRFEVQRSRIQDTADRAVLAAASLRQELNPQEVVADYFAKAGLSGALVTTTVDEGFGGRSVRVTTKTELQTPFLALTGDSKLESTGVSGAEERIRNVEISLVLDISGSMAQNNRMVNLKAAADEFIATMLANDPENRISISLVPFNGQVNIGPQLTARYNITHQHGIANVNCVDMPASVYSQLGLPRTLAMSQTAFADSFSTSSTSNSFQTPQAPNTANVWCPATAANFVRPLQRNAASLRAQVQNLQAIGATSIDAGLRWGLALLDPETRPVVSELITAGVVPAFFAGRPFDYGDPDVLKVIVLMTDGEHFPEERINDAYKSGLSPIWRSTGDGVYSIHHPTYSGSNKFWVPSRNNGAGEWRASAWNSGAGVQQLTWVQVWQQLRVSWVAWQLYARALGTNDSTRNSLYTTWMNNFRTQTAKSAMDIRLNGLCSLAKAQGVVIFGIAFEAPPGGVNAIRNCASPNMFYDVAGLEISRAFRQIRTQITTLRLTQ